MSLINEILTVRHLHPLPIFHSAGNPWKNGIARCKKLRFFWIGLRCLTGRFAWKFWWSSCSVNSSRCFSLCCSDCCNVVPMLHSKVMINSKDLQFISISVEWTCNDYILQLQAIFPYRRKVVDAEDDNRSKVRHILTTRLFFRMLNCQASFKYPDHSKTWFSGTSRCMSMEAATWRSTKLRCYKCPCLQQKVTMTR